MKKLLFFAFSMFFNQLVQADGVDIVDNRHNCSNTFSLCHSCTDSRYLFPILEFSSSKDSLEIDADNSEVIENNDYLITGNVSVKSSENFLSADKVVISKEKKSSSATGSVKYQDKNFLLTGSILNVKRQDDDELIVNVFDANYQEIKSKANGKAESINKNNNKAVLKNSTYSLCPINKNTWFIEADQITLDLENNRTVADKARLVFFDLPILYLPKYSWITNGRGSGFLSPGFNMYKEAGRESTEFQTRLPYYFNLAPDKDLLTAISYLSSRGPVFEGKYRQLIGNKSKDDGLFQLEVQNLFDDKISNTRRWLLDSSIELEVNNNVHLSMKYNKVSDSNYFRDVLRRRTDEERLNSHIKTEFNYPPLPEIKNSGKLDKNKIITVNYGRNIINSDPTLNQQSIVFSAENEQVINHGLPGYTKSFETALFSTKNGKTVSPFKIDLSLMSTKFNHKTVGEVNGIRTHGEIGITNYLGAIKYFESSQLTSKAKIGITNYSLINKNNKTRIFGSLDLDLDFPSYKSTNLFGIPVKREIKPSISYDFTSKHKQSVIPLFDTSDTIDNILTYSSIRSGERYNGIDRIINENDITLSLRSSYTKLKKPGSTILDFKVAQRYYGDKEAVSDSLISDFETRRGYSDIAASLDISLDDYDKIKSNITLQIDPKNSKVSKNHLSLIFKPHERKFISLKHSDDGSSRSLNLSGSLPLNNKIHFFAGIDKSLNTGVINKQTTGIVYEDCCWSARLGHFKETFVKDVARYDYSTGFELVFKGLGSTDTNLRNHIQANLPEYKVLLSE
jgi:LPS-assembly protein